MDTKQFTVAFSIFDDNKIQNQNVVSSPIPMETYSEDVYTIYKFSETSDIETSEIDDDYDDEELENNLYEYINSLVNIKDILTYTETNLGKNIYAFSFDVYKDNLDKFYIKASNAYGHENIYADPVLINGQKGLEFKNGSFLLQCTETGILCGATNIFYRLKWEGGFTGYHDEENDLIKESHFVFDMGVCQSINISNNYGKEASALDDPSLYTFEELFGGPYDPEDYDVISYFLLHTDDFPDEYKNFKKYLRTTEKINYDIIACIFDEVEDTKLIKLLMNNCIKDKNLQLFLTEYKETYTQEYNTMLKKISTDIFANNE